MGQRRRIVQVRRTVERQRRPGDLLLDRSSNGDPGSGGPQGVRGLDIKPFVLAVIAIDKPGDVFIVNPDDGPNPNWLRPSYPSQGQQRFGNDLLEGTSSSRSPAPSRPTAGT
jgi:hypothetical protein